MSQASTGYVPPLEDMHFVIEQVLRAPQAWSHQGAHADLDAATAREILEAGAAFAVEVLAPLNGPADLEGCHWSPEAVRTPAGFPQAWRQFVDGGWPALACDPAVGGQGLPQLLDAALSEMLVSANHAWTMYAGLLHGAYEVLRHHASPALQQRYLPEVVSGRWLATMNLTEPQAGSDLGLLRSRAVPVDPAAPMASGAAVRVSGQKIFISGGDQDLTDNIVHLVLARLPEAAPGTRGLSLFLVPKCLPDGRRNAVHCDGIEKKMGLKGSATCQMRFEQAEGWLLGEPGGGLAAMFLMMNSARLHVGLQGLGHLEAASARARAYALERTQLRAPCRPPGAPEGPADVIAWHPAMRRVLLALQARTEGARVLAYWCAQLLDEQAQHPDATRRADAAELVGLLTPVVKAFLTDLGHRGADDALGVLGGYGYIHDYGIEQHVRDSRVARLYEGTNEIQAIDLVMRKLLGRPRGLTLLLEELERTAAACRADAALLDTGRVLQQQIDLLGAGVQALREARQADAEAPLRVADDVMDGVGHVMLAWAWARIDLAAGQPGVAPALAERKRLVARHGLEHLLDASAHRWQRVRQWARPLPWVPA
ncbi:alkylation response protein AidB-like acyl-CoA dehydrogenase [Sphaerotilus hippei]|uniref:Alkylation response protein AidB-like acyl-CoA dehydrogenase n=1 Tax=Sphaerotilus hippei TaxID=744406 RepID=A0A318H331_9BURK|nr:acyl-CoA dehydrogenase family protein [Sphaerotilus hippei]PXW97653.1 alkylation response protein AidB-like acyl-CoA dehydrogenase [Sphaerotilus hippei]